MIRRRWFQFSLRGFILFLTVAAIWIGRCVEAAREQRVAVFELREIGADVFYDYQLTDATFSLQGKTFTLPTANRDVVPPCPTFVWQLLGVDFLYRASDVRLLRPDIHTSACKILPRLRYLRRLEIIGIDDDDTRHLAECFALNSLSANDGALSDKGVMLLSRLHHLTLAGCNVTEDGVQAFRLNNPDCDLWFNDRWWP
ncbi:MAG TPA: hypothetical protein VG125_25250 [Pirellulales bacterium]|jgi:hypothetical protein|nr:hypothetical protein [Pirellulales bacterium]